MFKKIFYAIIIAVATILTAQEQQPPKLHQTIMSVDVALTELFGTTVVTRRDTFSVDDTVAQNFQIAAGRPLLDPAFEIMVITLDGKVAGYAVISEEVGKFYPITFIVGVDTQFQIVGVRVLVYRESHGLDVKRGRFLRQYRGKQLSDPIAINRDIINISGATISVGALNRGVRKVLYILRAYSEVKK